MTIRRLFQIRSLSTKSVPHAFYDDKIVTYANRPIKPVTLRQLVRFGQTSDPTEGLQACAHYARTELPVRLARRVRAFQGLPFIVGTNPYIKEIYKLYHESFESLEPYAHDRADNLEYSEKLKDLVDRHADNIPTLARGFLECKQYMNNQDIASFLDDMIHARIGIRLIAEQTIALTSQPQPSDSAYIGIIDTQLNPAKLVKSCASFVSELCEYNYGESPEVIVNGHTDATFTYVPVHLQYILTEVLKNAYRASVEFAKKNRGKDSTYDSIPHVEITISHGKEDIGIRVRDRGGGVAEEDLNKVFEYSYTTVAKANEDDQIADQQSIFAGISEMGMQSAIGGPLAGLGFGLPLARMYARYFGGSFTLVSMNGYGCDVFLKLKHIDESMAELEI